MRRGTLVAGLVTLLAAVPAAVAVVPGTVPEAPVLAEELRRGTGSVVPADAVGPTTKTVDGDPADWAGAPTGFGGTTVYSAGEYVYQDHLFDARGADDGLDADRLAQLDPLREAEPRTYRIEPLIGQDAPSQFGIDSPGPLAGEEWYGDAGLVDVADLVEVRVAAHADAVDLLVRTTTMSTTDELAVLVLVDTVDGGSTRGVPFGSGLTTERAETAVLLADDRAWEADLASGVVSEFSDAAVAAGPDGWTNALEARLPRHALGLSGPSMQVAVATGRFDGSGGFVPLLGPSGEPLTSHVANVAFRTAEPVRSFFDRGQALALHDGSIDSYFAAVELPRLWRGETERFVPGPGYHDRIFRSADGISSEGGMDGVWQHYGLYLPDGWAADASFPLQWWFHWRGGHAHSAASIIPRMFQTLGDGEPRTPVTGIDDSVVVAPRGRGTSTWYVGLGHADFLEVWDDVHALLGDRVDRRREYVTGHSMGGWASYLMAVLYPDRFAASFPYSGPVTQGAWTGADFSGCDEFQFDEYTPCYVEANGGDARAQHTRRLLENLHHVPIAVFQGGADELVPTTGVTRQVEQLALLGQQHRYYLFPAYEHFSFPVVDEWAEGGRYAHRFAIPELPARVRYVRDLAFEEATEESRSFGHDFDFTFDSAYWMRGLTVAGGAGAARFDGRSLAVVDEPVAVPEAGGPTAPGQSGPYAMTGLRWVADPLGGASTSNGFEVTLEGASGVELDLFGMGLVTSAPIDGTVHSDGEVALRLDGAFPELPDVGCACTTSLDGGVLVVELPAGVSRLTIG